MSAQVVGLILLPFYTRELSREQFGFVDLVQLGFSLLIPVVMLQLHLAMFRFLIGARGDESAQRAVVTNGLRLVAILLALAVVVATVVLELTGAQGAGWIVAAAATILVFQAFSQIARGVGRNVDYAIGTSITAFGTLLAAFVFVGGLHLSVQGVFIALIAANLCGAAYLAARLRLTELLDRSAMDAQLRREMLRYSVPLLPNGLAWWVNNAADRYVIAFFMGTAANGVYAAWIKMVTIVNAPSSVFTMSWAETASLHVESEDRDEFFSSVANVAVRIFGGLGLVLIASLPFLSKVLIDPEFAAGWMYAPVAIVGACLNVLVGVYDGVYVAKKKTKQIMVTTVIAAVLNFVLSILLVPQFGLVGAASGTCLTFGFLAVFRHFTTRKYVRIRYQWKMVTLLLGCAAPVLWVYYCGTSQHKLVSVIFAVLVALILTWSQLKTAVAAVRRKARG